VCRRKTYFQRPAAFVTDGENANIGSRNSLWASLDAQRQQMGDKLSLINIWCGAHRSDLAFGSVSKAIPEAQRVIRDAVALATFFHTSGVRTKELEDIGRSHGLKVLLIPKYFEVKWSEFSYRLLSSILFSWQAIKYLQISELSDSSAKGYLSTWTDRMKLQTVCLLADTLMIYSRFQKAIQDDKLTVVGLSRQVEHVKRSIRSLLDAPLLGGWDMELAAITPMCSMVCS